MDEEIKYLNGEEPVTESANSTANKDVTVKKERWGLRWLAVIVSGLVIGAVIAVVFIAITTYSDLNLTSMFKIDVVISTISSTL